MSSRSAPIRRTELVDAAASGTKWTAAAGAVTAAAALLQTLVLATILAPSDFGLMAAAMVVLGLGQVFADGGVSYALLRSKSDTRAIRSSLYWLNVMAGALIFVLVAATSPLVASFYGQPRVGEILRWAALVFLAVPWGLQFQIMLQKSLRFRALASIQIAAAVFGVVAAIASAALGAGVFALVWGWLTTLGLQSLGYTVIGWRTWTPMRRFRRSDLAGYAEFGLYQIGERLTNHFTTNVDYVIVGYFLGPAALGIYSLAYQLVVRPLVYLNPVVTRVAFPIFARKQDDNAALARGYLHVTRIIAYIAFPVLGGIVVLAPTFVPLLLGEVWLPLVPILQVLSIVGAVRCVYNPAGFVVLAKGRADLAFKLNLAFLVIMASTLTVASQDGLQAVAWAEAAVVTAQGAAWWLLLKRLIQLSLHRCWGSVRAPLLMAGVAGACAWVIGTAIAPLGASGGLTGSVMIVAGGVAYGFLAVVFDRRYVKSALALLRRGPARSDASAVT